MKSIKWLDILSFFIAALFILSLFTEIAIAQTQEEQYEKAKAQYNRYKDKYEKTKVQFEKAKKEFEEANAKFKFAIDKRSRDELVNKAQEYLIKAIDLIFSYLDILKSRIENSENKGIIPFDAAKIIDGRIAQLELLNARVQQAKTMEELRNVHLELKDLLVRIRLETGYYMKIILNHRISNFVTKADNISTSSIDVAIQKLEALGKDTTKIEESKEKFDNLIKEAIDSQQKTNDLFANHSGFATDGTVTNIKDAEAFLRQVDNSQKETINKLKAASRQLQDFARDFRKISSGKLVVSGTGTIAANGTGRQNGF